MASINSSKFVSSNHSPRQNSQAIQAFLGKMLPPQSKLLRQLNIIAMIPPSGTITTNAIMTRLQSRGFEVGLRVVQRDMCDIGKSSIGVRRVSPKGEWILQDNDTNWIDV